MEDLLGLRGGCNSGASIMRYRYMMHVMLRTDKNQKRESLLIIQPST